MAEFQDEKKMQDVSEDVLVDAGDETSKLSEPAIKEEDSPAQQSPTDEGDDENKASANDNNDTADIVEEVTAPPAPADGNTVSTEEVTDSTTPTPAQQSPTDEGDDKKASANDNNDTADIVEEVTAPAAPADDTTVSTEEVTDSAKPTPAQQPPTDEGDDNNKASANDNNDTADIVEEVTAPATPAHDTTVSTEEVTDSITPTPDIVEEVTAPADDTTVSTEEVTDNTTPTPAHQPPTDEGGDENKASTNDNNDTADIVEEVTAPAAPADDTIVSTEEVTDSTTPTPAQQPPTDEGDDENKASANDNNDTADIVEEVTAPAAPAAPADENTVSTEEVTDSTTPTEENLPATNNAYAMDLNVAYEALEQVRQANVAIEFGRELGPKECTACLREPRPTGRRFRIPPLGLRAAPCLACGNQVCPRHRCPELKRENINICIDCSAFFSLTEFVQKVHDCEDRSKRKQRMNEMLDVYDRALLILQYSCQFIDEIAQSLEHNNKRNDKIGLGTSTTGFVSGIAGVAAAATIFTPVGPPLLIASILFGGGATAVSARSEAVNYHCNANKMADTIYALHGMVHSISRLAIEGRLWQQVEDQEGEAANDGSSSSSSQRSKNYQARNWTRATANALKPLTAGALSAVSVVMEAQEMKNTLDKINAGSPCDKAESLRKIAAEMDELPSTTLLAQLAPHRFKL